MFVTYEIFYINKSCPLACPLVCLSLFVFIEQTKKNCYKKKKIPPPYSIFSIKKRFIDQVFNLSSRWCCINISGKMGTRNPSLVLAAYIVTARNYHIQCLCYILCMSCYCCADMFMLHLYTIYVLLVYSIIARHP